MDLIISFKLQTDNSTGQQVIQFSNYHDIYDNSAPSTPDKTQQAFISEYQPQQQPLLSKNELELIENMPKGPCQKRNVWSYEEDCLLSQLSVELNFDWGKIARHFPNKQKDQIIRRWKTRHDPTIKKTKWTKEEDQIILHGYIEFGGNWKKIAQRLTGRPASIVKNRFYGSLKKKNLPLIQNAKRQLSQWRENFLKKDIDEKALDELICEFDQFKKEVENPPVNLQRQLEDPEIRKVRIDELYRQMAALESYLNITREQLHILAKEAKEKCSSNFNN